MKGRESDVPTYLLHFYIIHSSATNRWEILNPCPSYRIKSSKIEDKKYKIIKKYGKYDDDRMVTSNQYMDTKLSRLTDIILT